RVDHHVVLGECQITLQSGCNRLHRRLPKRDTLCIRFTAQCDDRTHPLPGHVLGPLQPRLGIGELRPIPLQLQAAPTPLNRILVTMVRRIIQQLHRLVHGVSKWHPAREHLRPSATALRPMVHGELHEPRVRLLLLRHGLPLGGERIHDDGTCCGGTPKGERQCGVVLVDDPTRDILLLPPHSMITGLVVAAGETPARIRAALHRRLTIDTPSFDASCCDGVRGFFLLLSKMASVSLRFFWGFALTTLRSRKPRRLRTAAMGLGEGNGAAPYPCSRSASKAAWAVSLLEAKQVRNGESCGAWPAAC